MSETMLMIFLLLSILVFGAILLTLVRWQMGALQQQRQSLQQQEDRLTGLAKAQETATETATTQLAAVFNELLESHRRAAESQQQQVLQMTVSSLQQQQTVFLQTVSAMQSANLDGSARLTTSLTKTIDQALALIGTKDPVAYQMVIGAQQPVEHTGVVTPYTSADEGYNEYLEQQQAIEEAKAALEAMGVVGG